MKAVLMGRGMFCWCFCCSAPPSHEDWVRAVENSLQLSSDHCGLSPYLYQSLLLPGDDSDKYYPSHAEDTFTVFKGVPKRPFYRELGTRLYLWSTTTASDNLLAEVEVPLASAESLNLTESNMILVAAPPSSPSIKAVSGWLRQAGDRGVLRVLGMRTTVGTDPRPLLPPSWDALLDAASIHHSVNSRLTVGARARAKHAHRGSRDQFFGSSQGNDEEKNAETHQVLLKLLTNAAWLNCHVFAGTDGNPVLEIRIASGYGARWTADWSGPFPEKVEFRGFLEPQIEDGHEKGWRH